MFSSVILEFNFIFSTADLLILRHGHNCIVPTFFVGTLVYGTSFKVSLFFLHYFLIAHLNCFVYFFYCSCFFTSTNLLISCFLFQSNIILTAMFLFYRPLLIWWWFFIVSWIANIDHWYGCGTYFVLVQTCLPLTYRLDHHCVILEF